MHFLCAGVGVLVVKSAHNAALCRDDVKLAAEGRMLRLTIVE